MSDQNKIQDDINDDKPVYEAPKLTVLASDATETGGVPSTVENTPNTNS